MSPARPEELGLPHPRETYAFYGHAEAEQKLLADYRSGRIAHAWLIGGPAGIGKATAGQPRPGVGGGQASDLARRAARQPGGAARRRPGAPGPAGAGTHARRHWRD